jgi:hypothetical protein
MSKYCKATYKRTSRPLTSKRHRENENVHISMDVPKCPTFLEQPKSFTFLEQPTIDKNLVPHSSDVAYQPFDSNPLLF